MSENYCRPGERRPAKTPGRKLPRVGNTVSWGTLGGQRHRGKVVEMDGNVAHVVCEDGVRRCVEC